MARDRRLIRAAVTIGAVIALLLATLALALTPYLTSSRSRGKVLWSAGAARPLYDEWASYSSGGHPGVTTKPGSYPQDVRQVTYFGRRAYRLTVHAWERDLYTPGAQRTELAQGNPGRTFSASEGGGGDRQFRAGQQVWIAEMVCIPADVTPGTVPTRRGFFVIQQFHMTGPGGPPLSVGFFRGRLSLAGSASIRAGSTVGKSIWVSRVVPRDRWIKLVFHIRWSLRTDGFVELMGNMGGGNGMRQFVRYSGPTLKQVPSGFPEGVHARIGVYRHAINSDTTIYFSGYTVATSRAVAESGAGF